MNVGELRAVIVDLPDNMEVQIRYETYAVRPVDDEETGVENGEFRIVAIDH